MGLTTQSEVANALTAAMQVIAESNAQSQDATLTIEAEIIKVIDEGLGTYKVLYLGNKFEATTAHTEMTYEVGDMVYVIIPNGNFDKNKIILSPVNPSTAAYTTTKSGSSYVAIGDNIFANVADVSLCTYRPHDADPTGTDPSPIVAIDTTGFAALFQSALADSRIFNFTCKIQTNIEKDRRSKGNYGLILDIPVIQVVDGVEEKKYYSIVVDINNITGDPYNLSVPTLQNFYFELPEDMSYDNTLSPRIRSFVTGFLGEDSTAPDDIFIRNIQLLSTIELKKENRTGYYSLITASEGTSFLASRTSETKTLSVNAYLNGRVTKVNKFDCYWFKENVLIDATSEKFQKFGGVGWEILNKVSKKSIGDDGKIAYQYVTDVYTQVVAQSDIHCDTRFKCVLVKDESVINSTIVIKNLASTATLELVSQTGNSTYPVGIGDVKLQLKYKDSGITDVPSPEFIVGYAWQRFDKKGNYLDNDFYTVDSFNVKENDAYITKISYPVSKIDESNTLACTAYIDTPADDGNSVKRQIIGTVWLTVTTGEPTSGRIILTNGDKIYKYDADGDSPMVADYDGPLSSAITKIDPISVAVYKEDGTELTEDEYRTTKITWLVPVNSMITLLSPSQKTDTVTNPGYYTISGLYSSYSTLNYSIAPSYNKNKLDNTIIVKATAPSAILKDTVSNVANIRFLKDGEAGTNGSKYSALITYNKYAYGEKGSNGLPNKLQLIYEAENQTWYLYNPANPGSYSVFESATLVPVLYVDGVPVTISIPPTWGIFDDSYNYKEDAIVSPVSVSSDGELTLNKKKNKWTNTNDNFCTTIEVKVAAQQSSTIASQTNSEEYVYAYYPIECTYVAKASYLPSCLPTLEGGFSKVLYASDGTNPQYDNSEPFYVYDAAYDESIADLYNYNWSVSSNMKAKNGSGATCKVTPTTKYDNGVAKNFVRVDMGRDSSKTDQVTTIRNQVSDELTSAKNRLNYYKVLQDNLDIFGNFDYNNYISKLTDIATFYNAKTKIIEAIKNLQAYAKRTYQLSTQYLYNNSVIDTKVKAVYDEAKALLPTLDDLATLSAKLGTQDGVIAQIEAITPSSLLIDNEISYTDGQSARGCYFSINDSIQTYNDTVQGSYTTYYTQLVDSSTVSYESAATEIIDSLTSFVNDGRFTNLTESYSGYDEESYRYTALVSTLKSRVASAAQQLDTYSYTLFIENILRPIYDSLAWYIKFYNEGGYADKISSITSQITTLTSKLAVLDNMLIPGDAVNIIHIKPITMLYNRYEMSNINGWNGNKLETGDGYLLAPQIGAGKKNSNNTFTGIVMGVKQVAEKSTANQKIGLFGYSKGAQSIFLDAEDGSALFGKSGGGQIVIDPAAKIDDKSVGLLYSSNFWKNYNNKGKPSSYSSLNYNTEGMLIDLTTPQIRYGSGNFTVDSDGNIHAGGHGDGDVGGWYITDYALESANYKKARDGILLDSRDSQIVFGSSSGKIYSGEHNTFSDNLRDGFYLDHQGLSIGKKLKIDSAGKMEIGDGAYSSSSGGRHWTIDATGAQSYIGYKDSTFSSNNLDNVENYKIDGSSDSIYLGTDGIRLGQKFAVDSNGNLVAKHLIAKNGGNIGGWTISPNQLSANNLHIHSNGSIYTENYSESKGKSGWSISSNGNAYFNALYASNSGTIGGWTIGSSSLTAKNIEINATGSIQTSKFSSDNNTGWKITSDGYSYFNNVTITGGSLNINNRANIDSKGNATFNNITCNNIFSFGAGTNKWTSADGKTSALAFGNGTIALGGTPSVDPQGTVTSGISYDSSGNVKIGGDIYANNGYFKGDIVANKCTLNGTVTATGVIFKSAKGGEIKLDGGTIGEESPLQHPYVSGLNVGEAGIAVNGGITCTSTGRSGSKAVWEYGRAREIKTAGDVQLSGKTSITGTLKVTGGSSYLYIGDRTLSEWTNGVCDAHDAELKQWVTDNFETK